MPSVAVRGIIADAGTAVETNRTPVVVAALTDPLSAADVDLRACR